MIQHHLCPWCRKSFQPHVRLGNRQKSCGNPDCIRKQKNCSHLLWKTKNKKICKQTQQDWNVAHPDYWKHWRSQHPDYVLRNRIQSKIRWRLSRLTLQKRIDILQVTEKQMEYWHFPAFAKHPRSLVPLFWAY